MTTIIQTTPWGVCQRYYDDCGELLYSAYVSRPSTRPARGHAGSLNQVRPDRRTHACLPIAVNFAAQQKKLRLRVELAGA